MKQAQFHTAELGGADFSKADLTEANLDQAKLDNANFHGTNLTSASMNRASLTSADLDTTFLIGASIILSDFSGANLSHAIFYNNDCGGANFFGAILDWMDLGCDPGDIEPKQLEMAVGNRWTTLPGSEHYVWSCLDPTRADVKSRLPELEALVSSRPITSMSSGQLTQQKFKKLLFCSKDETAHATGTTGFERRFWKDFCGIDGFFGPGEERSICAR